MKKLRLYTGGHPYANDDLLFLQTLTEEAIGALVSMYGPNFILSGVERTSSSLTVPPLGPQPSYIWTAGWIVLNGELLYFPGTERFQSGYTTDRFDVIENTVGDPVVYADTDSKSVYFARTAQIVAGVSLGNLATMEAARYGTYDYKQVGSVGNPAYQSNWAAGDGDSPANPLKFRLANNKLEFTGACNIDISIGSSPNLIFTLPEGYRPVTRKVIPCVINSSSVAFTSAVIIILSDGRLYVNAPSGYSGSITKVYFEGIQISLT